MYPSVSNSSLAGDEIPGTGGVRKLRFGASGRGKRGGVRVVYFFGGGGLPIYALLAYSKSDKTDLTPVERRAVAALVATIRHQREQGK